MDGWLDGKCSYIGLFSHFHVLFSRLFVIYDGDTQNETNKNGDFYGDMKKGHKG